MRKQAPLTILALVLALGTVHSAPNEAETLLDAAIAHQGPPELAKEGAIRDLSVVISAVVHDYSREPVQKTTLRIRRYLTMEPVRFRSEWLTSVNRQVNGFDGKRYWYAEYLDGRPTKDNFFLLGKKRAKEREKVQEEIDETRHLLRLFFLANLKGPDAEFTVRPDETITAWKKERTCRVVHRRNTREGTTRPDLTLYLDAKTSELIRADTHARKEGQRDLVFTFRYDGTRVKKVLFPFKIEVRERLPGDTETRLASIATVEENGIDFNTGLDPEIFQKPKKSEDE